MPEEQQHKRINFTGGWGQEFLPSSHHSRKPTLTPERSQVRGWVEEGLRGPLTAEREFYSTPQPTPKQPRSATFAAAGTLPPFAFPQRRKCAPPRPQPVPSQGRGLTGDGRDARLARLTDAFSFARSSVQEGWDCVRARARPRAPVKGWRLSWASRSRQRRVIGPVGGRSQLCSAQRQRTVALCARGREPPQASGAGPAELGKTDGFRAGGGGGVLLSRASCPSSFLASPSFPASWFFGACLAQWEERGTLGTLDLGLTSFLRLFSSKTVVSYELVQGVLQGGLALGQPPSAPTLKISESRCESSQDSRQDVQVLTPGTVISKGLVYLNM
ncbi:uncharacterized protein LOC109492673 [Felis catus]|uniref:uncharacterized protein LOC109492673 n=1 Tax=Felis catus TaxID=9685 RepID=UPI001D19F658|nr:uncharacterized protein LOC109492673 [Felis catus]